MDIEIAVLGGVVNSPKKFNDVAKYIISDEVWEDNRCKVLWGILEAMTRKNEHIDMITINSSLDASNKVIGVDSVFIVECTSSAGSEASLEVYAKKIYEKFRC